jgi:uroporphyrinogen decarboxylase
VRLALERRTTDRVPIALVCSGINAPARAELETYLQRQRGLTVDQYLAPLIDIKAIGPDYLGPTLSPGTDIWGVHRSAVSYGAGEYHEIDHFPLAQAETAADLARHRWPRTEWFDYAGLPAKIAAAQADGGPWCLMVMNANPFETSWYLRGFERMLCDFRAAPDLAHEILDRVTDFFVEHYGRVLSAARGEIDLAFTADDIGTQQGLLMSPKLWREFLLPRHRRLNARIHECGAKVIYHSDGAVMDAVPGLIEMGIDVLQALQFDAAGMDPALLKERYGDRLCFEGGVSVQKTLPFGTTDDVRREVRRLKATLGAGGGYILGPSHAIQAGTPPENIAAMFDEAAAG